MASLQDLRRRIASVRNTRKITKALELVAGARLRRAQSRIEEMRPYADHQLLHPVGVGPHLLDAALGASQPRAGHQLERLRDLARVADGRDPPPEILERRH